MLDLVNRITKEFHFTPRLTWSFVETGWATDFPDVPRLGPQGRWINASLQSLLPGSAASLDSCAVLASA